jgi:renalase
MLRVAVIGAGLAGLACAARLADAGCRVDVFEKSRGTGGRLNTRRDHGTGFDLGAQYFTARAPAFVAQVDAWRAAGAVARWNVEPWVIDAGGKLFPSPDDTPRWVGTPSMSALTQQLAGRNIALCTQTQVTRVERRDGRWTLYAESASFAGFHALVVAVPAPQAETLLGESPSLQAAAHAAVMEPCWAVAVGFDRPSGLRIDAAFARGQPVSWLARDCSKPGRALMPETWVLHAAPGWTEEHLESPGEAIARHLYRWFAAVVAPDAPAPAWLHAHRWRFARSTHAVADGHHFDERVQLGICGDWCNGGRVEGAWLSGHALAASVLAAHRL